MSDISGESSNKRKGLGRGLGSLLGGAPTPATPAPSPQKSVTPTQTNASSVPQVPPPPAAKASVQTVQPKAVTAPVTPEAVSAKSPGKVQSPAPVATTAPATVSKKATTQNPPPLDLEKIAASPSAVTSQLTPATASVPSAEVPTQSGDRIWSVGIEKLKSGKYQPRKNFEKESLEELAKSIKEHGILQPIVVRPTPNGAFEIIAGERRWRSAQAAGLREVPVIIRNYDNQKTLELSLIENLQRQDLNPIEEAEGYQRLMNEFALTQEQVAERVGKERATVANSLRLLKLAPDVRDFVQRGQLSAGHAKVLLGIQDLTLQKKLAQQVHQQQLSVRKLEGLVQQQIKDAKAVPASHQANVTQRLIAGLSDELQKLLGTRVSIDYQNSKGKLSVYFYTDDELTQIVDKIRNGAQL